MAPTVRYRPVPPIVPNNYPLTFIPEELRQKADRLAMSGHTDEAALLHALLDAHRVSSKRNALEDELRVVEDELRSAENDRDNAESTLDDLRAKAESALAAVTAGRFAEAETLLREIVG